MHALLVLDAKHNNARILVRLTDISLKKQVIVFLEKNRARDAFELIKRRAEVAAYLPPGSKLAVHPHVTLIEELL